jgi:hypothetical protein
MYYSELYTLIESKTRVAGKIWARCEIKLPKPVITK